MPVYLGSQRVSNMPNKTSTTSYNTNDATMSAADLIEGKTGYGQGKLIVGTLKPSKVYMATAAESPAPSLGEPADLFVTLHNGSYYKQGDEWTGITNNNQSLLTTDHVYRPMWAWGTYNVETDAYVELLLHCDTIVDSGPYSLAVANGGGVTTTTGKYGQSISSPASTTSAYLNITMPRLTTILAGDFTIDWWEYRTSAPDHATVFSFGGADTYSSLIGYAYQGDILAYISSNGSSWNVAPHPTVIGTAITNTWVHRAMVRQGSNVLFFENGQLNKTITGVTGLYTPANSLRLFCCWQSVSFGGRIDEFRVSSTARWTANFTPPSQPYSNEIYTLTGTVDSMDMDAYPADGYGDDGKYYKQM